MTPLSRTIILSAFAAVDKRCAIIKVVLFLETFGLITASLAARSIDLSIHSVAGASPSASIAAS